MTGELDKPISQKYFEEIKLLIASDYEDPYWSEEHREILASKNYEELADLIGELHHVPHPDAALELVFAFNLGIGWLRRNNWS